MREEPTGARLCPNCANTIEGDATKCRYCKAELTADSVPQWLNRNEFDSELRISSKNSRKSFIPTKFIWPAVTLVLALVAFYVGGYIQRNESALTAQAYSKRLQTKDQMLQDQEAQLNRLRQELTDKSNQLAEAKAKLEQSQKEASATQKRLDLANREVARLNTSRPAAVARAGSRASDSARSSVAAGSARRSETGLYETIRETPVFETPSSQARVVSQIRGGTRINVVNSAGDWLEVRSKHGNPPGYVRSDSTRLIARN
jgi:hypothetical protein